MLVACGGGDDGGGDDGGGDTNGTVTANVTLDGAPSTFSAPCTLTEDGTYLDITAKNDTIGFEIKWKKAAITQPGTYPTGGIVADIFLYALTSDDLLDATGSATFTTYVAPSQLVGTFMLTATGVMATGTFDCQ